MSSFNVPVKKGLMSFPTPPSIITLVLKVESKNAIQELFDFFSKSVACLHFRYIDDCNLEYNKNKIFQYTIPSELTDLGKICSYVGHNFTPPKEESFGSIAINEENKIIALNVSHRFCDGGFFKFLLDKFNKHEFPEQLPILPRFSAEIFRNEINDAPDIKSLFNDPSIFRLIPNKITTKTHPSSYFINYDIKMKANEFKAYDESKNSPRSITDLMYLSHYFASACYKEKLFDKFSVATIIDLRESLNYKPDFLNCYQCAQIIPTVSNISPNDKLSDLSIRLRNDLKLQRKQNKQFAMLKAKCDINSIVHGIMLYYSAVGVMNIKRPIIDAYAGILVNCSNPKSISAVNDQVTLFNWSVRDDERKKNDFTTQILYNPNIFDSSEMSLYGRRIKYFLHNISLDQKIGDVYNIIKKVK